MQGELLDLVPQTKFENLSAIYLKIAGQYHKYATIKPLDETEWLEFINKNLEAIDTPLELDNLNDNDQEQKVKWFQEDNFMSITIQAQRDDITCTEERITSPVINGLWWGPIKNLDIMEIGDIVQITFDTTFKWPYLIKGGNPDGLSCYFIALIALQLKELELCNMWLKQASMLAQKSAMRSYAMVLVDAKQYNEAIHWLARGCALNQDVICEFTLASFLLEGIGIEQNAPLAEFIFCRLCLQGLPPAYTKLGRLYLNGAPGVAPMREKAHALLSIAGYQFGDDLAIKILETADFSDNKVEAKEESKEEKNNESEKETPKEESSTFLDWLIGGTVIAGASIGAYYLFNVVRRR